LFCLALSYPILSCLVLSCLVQVLLALVKALTGLERSWLDLLAVRYVLLFRFYSWLHKENRLPRELAGSRGRSVTGPATVSSSAATATGLLVSTTNQTIAALSMSAAPVGIASAPNHSLASVSWFWALHCQSQALLIDLCLPPDQLGLCLWDNVRRFGIPLWCLDHQALLQIADKLAKQHFLLNRDPGEAALWYILLNRKSALQGLYKAARDERLSNFLANDFSTPRWKEAALKNAFALLGKQKYQLAVAMFLLGNYQN